MKKIILAIFIMTGFMIFAQDTIQISESIDPLEINSLDGWKYFQLLCLTVAGMVIFTLKKVKEHIRNFKFSILWNDMKFIWIWVFLFASITELILLIVPEVDSVFVQMLGMNIVHSAAGALMLGFGLTASFYNKPKRETDVVDNTVEN